MFFCRLSNNDMFGMSYMISFSQKSKEQKNLRSQLTAHIFAVK